MIVDVKYIKYSHSYQPFIQIQIHPIHHENCQEEFMECLQMFSFPVLYVFKQNKLIDSSLYSEIKFLFFSPTYLKILCKTTKLCTFFNDNSLNILLILSL